MASDWSPRSANNSSAYSAFSASDDTGELTGAASSSEYYAFSASGDTSELTGATGTVLNIYAYDPSGNSLSKSETVPNPFQFAGKLGVMSEGNGLNLMGSQVYVSSLGRFSVADSAFGSGSAAGSMSVGGAIGSATTGKGMGGFQVSFGATTCVADATAYSTSRTSYGSLGSTLRNIGIGLAIGGGVARVIVTFPVWGPAAGAAAGTLGATALNFYLTHPDECNEAAESLFENTVSALGGGDLPPSASPIDGSITLLFAAAENMPEDSSDGSNVGHTADTGDTWVIVPHDPNDKIGPSGFGDAGFVSADATLPYTIDFENTPTATAPAQVVTVTDQLDANLDWRTLQLGEITFGGYTLTVPAGRKLLLHRRRSAAGRNGPAGRDRRRSRSDDGHRPLDLREHRPQHRRSADRSHARLPAPRQRQRRRPGPSDLHRSPQGRLRHGRRNRQLGDHRLRHPVAHRHQSGVQRHRCRGAHQHGGGTAADRGDRRFPRELVRRGRQRRLGIG